MKILKGLGAILVVISLFWLLGTAGASECGTITSQQFWVQAIIGMGIGAIGLGLTNLIE